MSYAEDATFAQMAANILSIEGSGSGGSSGGGGGLPTGIAEIAYGVFTPTTKAAGVVPIIGIGGLPEKRAFLVEHGIPSSAIRYSSSTQTIAARRIIPALSSA